MTGRQLILEELRRIAKNCCKLLEMAKVEHLDYRPKENMRSLRELGNHLAQVPAVDLKIMRGVPESEVQKLEGSLMRDDPRDWCAVMREGVDELAHFVEHLTYDEYENGSGTAFYGRTQTYAQWLLEVVTHIYHHRSQFFTYLKLNGYNVNTRTLYQ